MTTDATDAGEADDEAGEREWRYELDEVGPDAEPDVRDIEPGSPDLENVVFFVLGVVVMVGVVGLLLFG